MTIPVLALRDLRVEAGGHTILDIPDFRVESNGVLAILGPNGAGKSTLLRVLAGLSRPSEGSLTFSSAEPTIAQGHDLGKAALRRRSAFVFQAPYLWTGSVRRNIELGLKFRRFGSEEVARRVESIAEMLGLGPLVGRWAATL